MKVAQGKIVLATCMVSLLELAWCGIAAAQAPAPPPRTATKAMIRARGCKNPADRTAEAMAADGEAEAGPAEAAEDTEGAAADTAAKAMRSGRRCVSC